MFDNAFMPLRTTVGAPLEVHSAHITARASALDDYDIAATRVENLTTTLLHRVFLPSHLRRATSTAEYVPGRGVATLPTPVDLPVSPEMLTAANIFTIVASGPTATIDRSRELWFEVEFAVAKSGRRPGAPILGGICYGGYPYLPYYITPQGENSANFGLPREIRIAWGGQQESAFLDDEAAITQQEPASHSGVHIMATGPIAAKRVKLRFADFPRLIRDFHGDGSATTLEESFGVYIPFLFFFTYQEDVRFRPRVPGGLLAATHVPTNVSQTYLAALNTSSHPPAATVAGVAADYVVSTEDPKEFFPLSGASIFHQRRQYQVHVHGHTPGDDRVESTTESFVSQVLKKGDQVRLFIAQSEEHQRCLAGMKLTFSDPKIVQWFTNGERARLDVKVYELDPIEGVSPVNLATDPATDKYANLIYHKREVGADSESLDCRFIRPVAARYLAVVFTNTGADDGHVAIDDLELVQSAYVTLSPRISRTQRVRTLNFRLIGANLGADYARLGTQGFTFTIERTVAGERKDVLFEARSLLDLLQLSGTRLYTNQRYLETKRDVSAETSTTLAGSHELRRSEAISDGWRRSRSGTGADWLPDATSGYTRRLSSSPGSAFETYSNAETRTRTEHLGFEDLSTAASINGALHAVRDLVRALPNAPPELRTTKRALLDLLDALPDVDSNSLRSGSGWGENERFWRGIAPNRLVHVQGLLNVSVPPILMPADFFQDLMTLFRNPLALTPEDALQMIVGNPFFPFLALYNGLGIGANVSGGASLGIPPFNFSGNAGYSVSTSQLLPTLSRTSTTGSNGTISVHASTTGTSFSQSRNTGYDDTQTYVEYTEDSPIHREITRDLYQEGTVRERTAGVGIFWYERALDIVSGTVPLNVVLPATADKIYRTTDETIRVRFGNTMSDGLRELLSPGYDSAPPSNAELGRVTMDVWFDLQEEVVRDDY